jgi:16S rRNA (adenine1518-N6/adenine1519-N6)-dimethyltransferase
MDSSLDLPPLSISALLRAHNLSPKKSLGQNYLSDPQVLQRIVTAAELTGSDDVLEIGPGLGSLTRYLAQSARQVTAVELDNSLIPVLHEVLSPWENVTIVHGDILKVSPGEFMKRPGYLVVANIPYYITSAVFRHLLTSDCKPKRMVLTVQQEVAQRICAGPDDMSLLALSVQVFGRASLEHKIPAGAFYPPPKVDSMVVKVELYDEPAIPTDRLETFFQLIKAGFSQKRKKLRNSLSAGLRIAPAAADELLHSAGIDPQRRAETLCLDEWRSLTKRMG